MDSFKKPMLFSNMKGQILIYIVLWVCYVIYNFSARIFKLREGDDWKRRDCCFNGYSEFCSKGMQFAKHEMDNWSSSIYWP